MWCVNVTVWEINPTLNTFFLCAQIKSKALRWSESFSYGKHLCSLKTTGKILEKSSSCSKFGAVFSQFQSILTLDNFCFQTQLYRAVVRQKKSIFSFAQPMKWNSGKFSFYQFIINIWNLCVKKLRIITTWMVLLTLGCLQTVLRQHLLYYFQDSSPKLSCLMGKSILLSHTGVLWKSVMAVVK